MFQPSKVVQDFFHCLWGAAAAKLGGSKALGHHLLLSGWNTTWRLYRCQWNQHSSRFFIIFDVSITRVHHISWNSPTLHGFWMTIWWQEIPLNRFCVARAARVPGVFLSAGPTQREGGFFWWWQGKLLEDLVVFSGNYTTYENSEEGWFMVLFDPQFIADWALGVHI